MLMCYEATRDLPLKEITIETPVAEARVQVISGKKIALVPILRAGLGMVEGILEMIPAAKVGHIGLYRNPETLQPIEYYCKLPNDIEERDVLLLEKSTVLRMKYGVFLFSRPNFWGCIELPACLLGFCGKPGCSLR